MAAHCNRRDFLKRTALLATVAAGAQLASGPTILAAGSPNSKIRLVLIGCGGRGSSAHLPNLPGEHLAAVVDVDENQSAKALKYVKTNAAKFKLDDMDLSKVKVFTDYRKMFDDFQKDFDAVVVATPDHQHSLPCKMAIERGKHVYCEKPLVHNMREARILGEIARKGKVATQMGNQGLGAGGDQALSEYLAAGAIGTVTEVHTWHGFGDRFGGSFPRPPSEPIPPGLHWDEWIGPAPYRDYHARCHPTYWHGYRDFGTGSLGGWGTHVWDAIDFALKLGYPTRVEVLKMNDPSEERFPMLTTICYDFPARGSRPALKVFWYEGGYVKGSDVGPESGNENTTGANRPKLAAEIEKKYGRKLGNAGSIFVGTGGMMAASSHGAAPRIVPEEKHKAFPVPPQTLPRLSKGGIWAEFLRACRDPSKPCISDFSAFACPLLEAMYVGHVAMRAGVGKKLEWDGPNMKCTNMPELNKYIGRDPRKEWEL